MTVNEAVAVFLSHCLVEQLAGKPEGRGFRPAGVAKDREQLGIGENLSPGAQQPPSRADRRLPDPEIFSGKV
jgi:hypothetical protein